MSQARVTDFFSQRKKVLSAPLKTSRQRVVHQTDSTKLRSAVNNEDDLCSSSIHEEFVRVIDEAAALNNGESATCTRKTSPSSPRTPKRTSTDSEFDLGSAVFSATATHSTAKKRRQVEAVRDTRSSTTEKKDLKRRARKKLVLPQDSAQVQTEPSEVTLQPSAPAAPEPGLNANNHVTEKTPSSTQASTKTSRGQVIHKPDIASLKTRLQRIKKHADNLAAAASDGTSSVSASPAAPKTTTSPASQTARLLPAEAKALKSAVAQASELAAKAQRRKAEERKAEESKQTEAQTQESVEQAAYQKYHTLAQAAPPGLSLPYHYKILAEMFRSMDTVVAMLFNRCETATFSKIKQGVQDMTHKRFEENHVCQIKTVFPEAFTFRQEKNIPTYNNSIRTGSYQLTVEPVLPSDQNEARPLLSASRLLDRRHIFHQNMLSIVKQHHTVFLSSLAPPMSVPEDKLTRWHPRFNVDTVPAIQLCSLPQPPHTEKLTTAQEVLDKARSLITPKIEKALVSLALKTEDKTEEKKETTSTQSPAVPETQAAPPTALKGVSQSLLDRIRAKEAQKLQAAMTRNSTQEERLLMMSRLPELARILRNVFVAEKKPALIMEVACNRMVASYRSALSTGEMEKHIRLLAEVAANWLTIHPIRKDFYLKMNKSMELNIVLDKLSSRLREEERL
ncbi:DNA replication factor Cdt1 [Notolabrus celidotus]|uniref:DNA replication factor Cdt1 n=1 Tax=Notolabrus celidotus TaxID=1203425 RepID=UPI00149017C5|nr:DNA replication factor Cdt1 [Notolabrus celidotus]